MAKPNPADSNPTQSQYPGQAAQQYPQIAPPPEYIPQQVSQQAPQQYPQQYPPVASQQYAPQQYQQKQFTPPQYPPQPYAAQPYVVQANPGQPPFAPNQQFNEQTVLISQQGAAPTTIVIWSNMNQEFICPYCHFQGQTVVRKTAGSMALIACCVMLFVGCFPCNYIPFCVDSCKDTEHYCSNCNRIVGKASAL